MPAFKIHETKVVDIAWDAAAQKTKVLSGEKRDYYGKIFAWYDPNADEGNKSDYKFIHHEVAANGDPGDAVTTACTSGIGVLNGGMGGTDIPKTDYQGVWDHLAKHLRDAGREPPPLNNSALSAPIVSNIDRAHLLVHAQSEIWAILPDVLRAALMNFNEHPAESIVEASSDLDRVALQKPTPKFGAVSRIPVLGTITHRDSGWSWLFGGGSTVERLIKKFRDVGADSEVRTVMLDIHSPGGTVSGMPELAAELRALTEKKHTVALANSLTASAAYWLASQADEIVATPEALVGSIGVFTMHEDYSGWLDQKGIKTTYISAGRYKTEANPDQPLSAEARDHIQNMVNDAYGLFVNDVARGRGVTPEMVRSDYGQGRVLTASDAKAAGMIDRVATSDETMLRLMKEVGATTQGSNSQAQIALKRRRLELLNKIYEEDLS